MRHSPENLKEGYHLFIGLANPDEGYDKAACQVEDQINAASEFFDIDLKGFQLKDEGPREIGFIVAQAAWLTRKK